MCHATLIHMQMRQVRHIHMQTANHLQVCYLHKTYRRVMTHMNVSCHTYSHAHSLPPSGVFVKQHTLRSHVLNEWVTARTFPTPHLYHLQWEQLLWEQTRYQTYRRQIINSSLRSPSVRTTSILEIPEENSKCFPISVYRHNALREQFIWEQLLCYITEALLHLPFPTVVNAPLEHIICELLLCEQLLYVTYLTRYSIGPCQLLCTRELAKPPTYIVPVQMWIVNDI